MSHEKEFLNRKDKFYVHRKIKNKLTFSIYH